MTTDHGEKPSCTRCAHKRVCQYRRDVSFGSFPFNSIGHTREAPIDRIAGAVASMCSEFVVSKEE